MMFVKDIPLNDGTTIPQLGLGTYRLDDDTAERVVSEALEVGYRHIDTASLYGNEVGVGRAIAASGIARDELYITTKCWNSEQTDPRAALGRSLEKLGLDHVDLYLVHWPAPARGTFVGAWNEFEVVKADGLTTSIGVSNFLTEHLDAIAAASSTVPVLNQIELHPLLQQNELRAVHAERGIATESWGPLGHGKADLVAELPGLTNLAERYGKTPQQVVLRWHIQEGLIVFPKTTQRERLIENMSVWDFEITDYDMDEIRGFNRDERIGAHPLEGNWD